MAEKTNKSGVSEQILSLPKGGGAIKGMGEKFQPDLHTGTGNFSIPLELLPGRNDFTPDLALAYSTGAGNGPFGLGWSLSIPNISRKTSKGIPLYDDSKDIFILSGTEDLVKVEQKSQGSRQETRYRPRTEGLFARILHIIDSGTKENYWEIFTQDGVKSTYGRLPDSQIYADNHGERKIFAWYLLFSEDLKGNKIQYHYKRDKGPTPAEYHHEYNQVYLTRIEYGNYFDENDKKQFLFQVDLDYGEYDALEAKTQWDLRPDPFSAYRSGFEIRTLRQCKRILIRSLHPEVNAPSHLIRSYDFSYAQDPLSAVCLLTDVTHKGYASLKEGGPDMKKYRHRKTNLYLKSFPPVTLNYSQFDPFSRKIEDLDFDCERPPEKSLADPNFELVDLYGNGLPDIIHTTDTDYFCWRNLGNGRFGAPHKLGQAPAGLTLSDGGVQLADMEGNGSADFLVTEGSARGFYENCFSGEWEKFHPYSQSPSFNLKDPNVKLVDLDGDGVTDVLATFDHHFLYIKNQPNGNGRLTFADPVPISRQHDPENWPDVYFAHPENRIRLADMSGDGLQDIVQIYDGRVDYWPNLGHGRWGKRLTLANGPHLPGSYDPKRLFLADINGDGLADLIYVDAKAVHFWINQSGNAWSEKQEIACSPPVSDVDSVRIADVFGAGTGGILWSFDWSVHRQKNYKFLDFTGGVKPHLLISIINNMGAETHVQHAPSTKFYLEDGRSGKPWITKLPFPVQVVEQVDTIGRISRNRFSVHYAYHHGYFDGKEREFRGFGMVEQKDTQNFATLNQNELLANATNIDEASHVPPLLTKTWFHTGAYLEGYRISRLFEKEYYQEPGLNDKQLQALLLVDTVLPKDIYLGNGKRIPHNLSSIEKREAARTLRGSVLRQEVYALDGTEQEAHPYSVKEQNYSIELLKAREGIGHAIFFVHPRESIDFHYERKLYDVQGKKVPDPRVTHALTLAVDDYGNVQQSVSIAYGRRHDDPDPLLTPADKAEQKKIWITYTENKYTNDVQEKDSYLGPLICETRSYEILQATPKANDPWTTNLFRFEEISQKLQQVGGGQHDLAYENVEAAGMLPNQPYRRLIEHERVYYRKNDLAGPLPLGALETMALPFEAYKLALTPGLIQQVFQGRAVITDQMLSKNGRYIDLDQDKHWWIPSGKVFYSPNELDSAALELTHAKKHFYLPHRMQDPFEQNTLITYDTYDLLALEVQDPLQNKVTAGERDSQGKISPKINYRVLQPTLITDPNGNRSAVVFDALGMVTGTAVMGRTGEKKGDLLDGFWPDLDESTLLDHLNNPLKDPWQILKQASTRLVYDLFGYQRTQNNPQPQASVVYTMARETHAFDLKPGEKTKVKHSFSYSDGFGRELQSKIQAEPEKKNGISGPPRWVGSGWAIFNNKGKPVRQYEPFFSMTSGFEFAAEKGVSPILFYDPAERVVATLNPNHTYEKVVFDPWKQVSWDANDTVLLDPQKDPDVESYFKALAKKHFLPTWYERRATGQLGAAQQDAALKTAKHADTSGNVYLDTLGRPFLTIEDNGTDKNGKALHYKTLTIQDIEGNTRALIDARGNTVMQYHYDLLGTSIKQLSMDAGERWMLNNVAGNPIWLWDSRKHEFSYSYDELQRPTNMRVKGGEGNQSPDHIYEKITYGDWAGMKAKERAFNQAQNRIGEVREQYDGAGKITFDSFDFKGNLLESTRELATEYKQTLNWDGPNPDKGLEKQESFSNEIQYDALDRVIFSKTPDGSITEPGYNEANLLEKLSLTQTGTPKQEIVKNIDYDEKGQRKKILYGNGVISKYDYDQETFRLIRLQTLQAGLKPLQDLSYTYDPVGNITQIVDDCMPIQFFKNYKIEPKSDYTYDPLYRLVEASGREHKAQTGFGKTDNWNDLPFLKKYSPNDTMAWRTYTQLYKYDAVGNIEQMKHLANGGGWTRSYQYEAKNNRLKSTNVNGQAYLYPHHPQHGFITEMPHLKLMQRNVKDELHAVAKQQRNDGGMPETTYYVYDAEGQRVRKVTETQAAPGAVPTKKSERIYLDGIEIYRHYSGSKKGLQRTTVHVMDDSQRIAMIESRNQVDDGSPKRLLRYQFGNHLGSSILETNGDANKLQIISYEEYHPFGTTAYQAVNKDVKAAAKRYKYTAKERDGESGLYYYGARYYNPSIGKFLTPDPLDGLFRVAGLGNSQRINIYSYVHNNPINYFDPSGLQERKIKWRKDDFDNPIYDPKTRTWGEHLTLSKPPSGNQEKDLEPPSDLTIWQELWRLPWSMTISPQHFIDYYSSKPLRANLHKPLRAKLHKPSLRAKLSTSRDWKSINKNWDKLRSAYEMKTSKRINVGLKGINVGLAATSYVGIAVTLWSYHRTKHRIKKNLDAPISSSWAYLRFRDIVEEAIAMGCKNCQSTPLAALSRITEFMLGLPLEDIVIKRRAREYMENWIRSRRPRKRSVGSEMKMYPARPR